MTEQELEYRLREDGERLQAPCPPSVRHRVSARIGEIGRRSARRELARPALAGAFGALAVLVSVWMLWRPSGLEEASPSSTAGLNAAPIVASSDRLLASREAALQDEWRLLERDLRNLRDHVTATFDRNPSG